MLTSNQGQYHSVKEKDVIPAKAGIQKKAV